MRIALITPGFSASEQDWCVPALLDFVRYLADRHDVAVHALTYPFRSGCYTVHNAEVHSYGGNGAGRIATLQRTAAARRAVLMAHHNKPFDAVIGFWANYSGRLAVRLGRKLDIPSVLVVMGGELTYEPVTGYGRGRRFSFQYLARKAVAAADCLIVGSAWHGDRLKRDLGGNAEVIPFGIDPQRFHQEGEAAGLPGDPAFLSVGSLVQVKGHATVLRAFAEIVTRRPAARLHLAGAGPLHSQLLSLASHLNIAGRVTFHGAVSHSAMPAFYRAADLCLLGSHFENLGMTFLEAGACARLTVGTNVGVLPELLPDSLLCTPGDACGLAGVVHRILANPAEHTRLRAALAAKVHRRYTMSQTVDRIEALLRDVCAERAVRPIPV